MIITVIGASGFIGRNLINYLLKNTNDEIRAYCRSADKLSFPEDTTGRITYLKGSVYDVDVLAAALEGADAALYLVHMMQTNKAYVQAETRAAHAMVKAGLVAKLPRLVFLGGLGDDTEKLSAHLKSRHHTGEILRNGLPLVIEFRASMVVGPGSVGFEVIRTLAAKLPVMAIPTWAIHDTQPIGLSDALAYLNASLTVKVAASEIVEIGGPRVLTYPALLARYAKHVGKPGLTLTVPFVPVRIAAWWLERYMPQRDAIIGTAMVETLRNSMVVQSTRSEELFPNIKPKIFEESF
jgi:uncharacterized protein YbjT (DUF2867 family)